MPKTGSGQPDPQREEGAGSRAAIHVYYGVAGSGKTEAALERYREALEVDRVARTPGRCLWLVPTHRAQRSILARLTSGHRGVCLMPQVLTFDRFAQRVLTAVGDTTGLISPIAKRILLRHILQEQRLNGQLEYFAAIAETPGFMNLLQGFIAELKHEEIWPEHFQAASRRSRSRLPKRDAELGGVYTDYQAALLAQQWFDAEGRFWLARTALQRLVGGLLSPASEGEAESLTTLRPSDCGPWRMVVVDGFADFTHTQIEMLELLAGVTDDLIVTLPAADLQEPTSAGVSRSDLYGRPRQTYQRLRAKLPQDRRWQLHAFPSAAQLGQVADPARWRPAIACIAQKLFRNPREIVPSEDGTGLEVIAATGPVAEQTAVAGRIKRLLLGAEPRGKSSGKHASRGAGVNPEEIIVGVRSIDRDGPAWAAALAAAGIPVWSGAARMLGTRPIIKALFALLHLEIEDWAFPRLQTLLNHGGFRPRWDGYDPQHDPQATVTALREAKLHADRLAILRVVQRLAEPPTPSSGGSSSSSAGAAEEATRPPVTLQERSVRAIRVLRALDQDLTGLRSPATLDDWADRCAVVVNRLGFLTGMESGERSNADAATASADRADWGLLQSLLRDAAATQARLSPTPPRLAPAEFLTLLRELVALERLPDLVEDRRCVRVLAMDQLRHESVPYLFLVGLDEQSFPRGRTEDCLLSEADREQLNASGLTLPHRDDHTNDELLLFYTLVTRATQQLTLSYPAVDHRGQPLFPSPYVAAVMTLFSPAAHQQIQRHPVEGALDPVPVLETGLTRADLRLVAVREARSGRYGLWRRQLDDEETGVYRNLLAAARVAIQRFHTRGFTAYEGRLSAPVTQDWIARHYGPERQFSATELEIYARCPFEYWLNQILQLAPLEEPDGSPLATNRGTLLHDVLAMILREDPLLQGESLVQRFRELVTVYMGRRPIDTDLQRVLREIEQESLELYGPEFAEQVATYWNTWVGGRSLAHLPPEVPFGEVRYAPGDDQHQRRYPPLEVGQGAERVLMRGRIDRVDYVVEEAAAEPSSVQQSRTEFAVIDYKSGGANPFSEKELRAGRVLQIAVYALAVKRLQMLGPEAIPRHFGYWKLSEKGYRGETIEPRPRGKQGPVTLNDAAWAAIETILEETLPRLVAGIRSASFVVDNPNEGCTKNCSYRTVCRVNQVRPLAESLAKFRPLA